MLQFMFQIRLVVSKLLAEMRADFQFLFRICHRLNPAEHDNTFDMQRPLTVLPIALVIDTVGNLVALGNGIDFVTCFRSVEIQLAVCFRSTSGSWESHRGSHPRPVQTKSHVAYFSGEQRNPHRRAAASIFSSAGTCSFLLSECNQLSLVSEML